jgi:hypothetical protein
MHDKRLNVINLMQRLKVIKVMRLDDKRFLSVCNVND